MLGLRPLSAVNTICCHSGQHCLISDQYDIIVHVMSVTRDTFF